MRVCGSTETLLYFLVTSPQFFIGVAYSTALKTISLIQGIFVDFNCNWQATGARPNRTAEAKAKGSHRHRRNIIYLCKCKTNITSLPHSLYLNIEHHQSNSKLVVWTNMRSTARRDCVARPSKLCDYRVVLALCNCDNQPHTALFASHFLNKIMKLIIAVLLNRDT